MQFSPAVAQQRANATADAINAAATADALDELVVARTPLGRPITRGQLKTAFTAVQNVDHWKNPIDARLSVAAVEALGGKFVIVEAIRFFAGCESSWQFDDFTRTHRIMAAGYFVAVGA